jgi:hypothetical protein
MYLPVHHYFIVKVKYMWLIWNFDVTLRVNLYGTQAKFLPFGSNVMFVRYLCYIIILLKFWI